MQPPFRPARALRIVVGTWLAAAALVAAAADSALVVRPVSGTFAEVKERILDAIANRGLVVNYTAHIGEMLDRTGRDIGASRRLYTHAHAIEFCSAAVSRRTLEADPHNIGFCPYVIAVYELPQEPGRIYVSHRRMPASASMRPADELVRGILDEALR